MSDMTDIPGDAPGDDGDRAAEYVLGTLSLQERLAFEAALARDGALRQAVAAWSARLQPLADAVPPVAPPADLRARLLAQIAPSPAAGERPFSLARWFGWTFGLSALAGAVAVALVFLFTPRPPDVGGFAMLHRSGASKDVIAFQFDKKHKDMVILASAAGPETGRDYELWVLPPHKAPVSLGVIKAGLREERPIPDAAAPYITDYANLAVSVEPAGGSPTGAPTGAVVFTGLVRMMDKLTE
jgi:anti-sigma-K factor RskA